ncbi:GINS complex subunit 2 [Geosmithia morbida]|uniref:DNA replication complex GINS protein PSF2 n=1 Tax=Geosmithia morbida TaxID=1094350 RepID=A0A9P5D4V5_9HYPO|nr:GINS complex subunit 2 [Geosmithia morbida]KAF4126512.1 GINS complex subunit 2 [Geosmithia morbida]
MELVTVVPRQKLESISLLSNLPLWLALLLKKQRRANIVPPPWLHPDSLRETIHHETKVDPTGWMPPPAPPTRSDGRGNVRRVDAGEVAGATLSPPFLPSCTADAPAPSLPYHWLEMAETLLAHASDDIAASGEVRSLLRDLHEVRSVKMRAIPAQLEAGVDGVMSLRGVGAMELAESRGLVTGVLEGVRRIGASAEVARREEEEEEEEEGGEGGRGRDISDDGYDDDDMRL